MCRLTVITAPAGAGKTTALALCRQPDPGRWPGTLWGYCDNRPGVFWARVVAALAWRVLTSSHGL